MLCPCTPRDAARAGGGGGVGELGVQALRCTGDAVWGVGADNTLTGGTDVAHRLPNLK